MEHCLQSKVDIWRYCVYCAEKFSNECLGHTLSGGLVCSQPEAKNNICHPVPKIAKCHKWWNFTLPIGGMYCEIYPRGPISLGRGFCTPRARDFALRGPGVQNLCPREISRFEGICLKMWILEAKVNTEFVAEYCLRTRKLLSLHCFKEIHPNQY